MALSVSLISAGASADDIVAVHERAVAETIPPDDSAGRVFAQRVLLEVLVAYGMSYSVLAERLLSESGAAAVVEKTRADDAEQAQDERLELLAGVSHELGTPLTVVKANISAIRRFLEDHDSWPEELSQREDDVQFAVERMVALRDELLAASRNRQREFELVPLHLVRCLQRVVRWSEITAGEKGIKLSLDFPGDLPYVLGDDGAVLSIFSNLLSNAVRYTPASGTISVTMRSEGASVAVAVTDTGIGMSAKDLQRIFERFYRTPEAQKASSFGLGLGLAITRDLVTALGGTIGVTSAPGIGSTFTVHLPVAPLIDAGV